MTSRALWLPSWYPHKNSLYDGDFIERHAKAASLYFPLQVLFVVKDPSLSFGEYKTEERKYFNDSSAWIYYFGSSKNKFADSIFSFFFKLKFYTKAYKRFYTLYGKPNLLHVHVAINIAWLAYRWNASKKIPLIISEHWTGYLAEANDEWKNLSFTKKYFIQKLFSKAVLFTAVSEYLASNIKLRIKKYPHHSIVSNAVDTGIFRQSEKNADKKGFNFIHVSTLTGQKNFDEIIEACAAVKLQGYDFNLTVISNNQSCKTRIEKESLDEEIIFKNEMPQHLLAKEMQQADALILYSLFETFGCVIIEANACGIPCIVSDIKAFDKNVVNNITGKKIPLHRPEMLAAAMIEVMDKKILFKKETIIGFAEKNFSMENIGKLFLKEYIKTIGFAVSGEINSKEK